VVAIAAWLISTGLMTFVVSLPGRRKPKGPPVTPPKAPARDATLQEALQDMQGKGGVLSSLDEREF
jgi:hypothetical protein